MISYDYYLDTCQFVVRMPSVIHDDFLARIVSRISAQLGNISNGVGVAADFAERIRWGASPTLKFSVDDLYSNDSVTSEKFENHVPDAVFMHQGSQWPAMIIEVAYTQNSTELKRLAELYGLASDGNVRVILGLKIVYKQSKRATWSLWQPKYVYDERGQVYLEVVETQSEVRACPLNISRSSC